MTSIQQGAVTTVRGPERVEERSGWTDLYQVGAACALLTAVIIPLQIAAYIIWQPPAYDAIRQWFTTFHDNALVGLLSMDLLLLVDEVLLIPIVLALYVALRRHAPSLMLAAVGLFFVSIAAFFASNTAFQMLSLSDQYAAAHTVAERASYVAAGRAAMATYQGTAFIAYYLLGSVAGVLIGMSMLRRASFTKAAAYAAIMGNAVGLALYVPVIGVFLSVLSGAILWIWYALIARDLWKLGGAPSE